MKRTSLIAFAILTVSACVSPDERSAMELAERIVPAYADNISFVQTEDTVDVFELSMKGDRLVIKGNNANSMAVGLNHYL